MRILTLSDSSGGLSLTDRPTGDDFLPLPHGLTLDDAVAVRASDVRAGDLVVAKFSDGAGVRPTEHIPAPYLANPHAVGVDCPCGGCAECQDLETWTLAEPDRVAGVAMRFICLAPAENSEPCTIVLRNRPLAVISSDVVKRAQSAAEKPRELVYSVTWHCNFDASTPQEAVRLAYEQLLSYATDAWPPVLDVEDEQGERLTIDMNTGSEVGR
ncbi:hypothetical protein OG413_43555 [Streptomyces sp. NBC_01433]|uniref:hypothetical protein n=1 Tax=Streptomyces sp. NBC_01433 TaxID=2903864 RepID=UPI0022541F16|nr:hypothetical protein [Streptomyces sp. NBC_01433]MCX4682061.1 hypothetical protein [Streptomyces sp. NBC_01433]